MCSGRISVHRAALRSILFLFLSLGGWTLKADSLTWLFLLMSPPIKASHGEASSAPTGSGTNERSRRGKSSIPLQLEAPVTSAIDHPRSATRALLESHSSDKCTRHWRVSDIFIDIKTMNINTSVLDTRSRDAVKAFLLVFFVVA